MWVKVCGIRNQSTATALAGLPDGDRPDAVGLNFFPGSRRCINIAMAGSILASLDGKIEPVGLFVNAPLRDGNFRHKSVDRCAKAARPIYKLLGGEGRLVVRKPSDTSARFIISARSKEALIQKVVVENHIRMLQVVGTFQGDKAGIPWPCAYKVDLSWRCFGPLHVAADSCRISPAP